jgi:hypothetical protein
LSVGRPAERSWVRSFLFLSRGFRSEPQSNEPMVGAVGSRPAWTRQLWLRRRRPRPGSHPARRIRPHRCRPRRSPRQRPRHPPLSRRRAAPRAGQDWAACPQPCRAGAGSATTASPAGTRRRGLPRRESKCPAMPAPGCPGSRLAARRPASISTGRATALGVGDSHGRQSGTERHSVCPGVDSVKGSRLGLLNCTLRERDRVQGVVLSEVGVQRGGLGILFVHLRFDA